MRQVPRQGPRQSPFKDPEGRVDPSRFPDRMWSVDPSAFGRVNEGRSPVRFGPEKSLLVATLLGPAIQSDP